MERNELVQQITTMVMSRLAKPAAAGSHARGSTPADDACDESCPPAWDGLGRVSDLLGAGASRLSCVPPLGSCPDKGLARLIDHTLLKAEATASDVTKLCEEAAANCFMSVCVNPAWVPLAARLLRGSGVKVCTVIGFPLGATFSRVKELETRVAIDEGAGEVDMVLNVGAARSGNWKLVEEDIRAVIRAARGNVITKVILETCYLNKDEIRRASQIAVAAGSDFLKTSTGFGPGGATVEHIQIMREIAGSDHGVKASGGIRDHQTALDMIGAGASRIGASASVAIVNCQDAGKGKY